MPTTPTYTRTNLRSILNSRVHGKLTNLIDANEILNSAVRYVIGDIDLRSTKRRSALSPAIVDDQYSYTLPADVKGNKIIDIIPQVKYEYKPEWDLVTEEYFDRMKERRENLVSIADDDLDRRLLVSRLVKDQGITIAQFEDPTGDGDTWSGFAYTGDTDGQAVTDSDIKEDDNDYVVGNGSVRFSDNGDTTATQVGVENRNLDDFDISEYKGGGYAYVRGRLTTGDTDITALNLRIGSDSDNYYLISDSATNEGFAFQTGWNNVRLDFANRSVVGSPTDTAIDYVALYWTKTVNTHLTDTNYGFDQLVLRKGQIHDLLYYSRYLWQNASGTYLENSTANTDYINVQNDELEIIITKAWELASIELRDYKDKEIAMIDYANQKTKYEMSNPSEAMSLIEVTYEFESAPINYRGGINDTMST